MVLEDSTWSYNTRPIRYTWFADFAPGVSKQEADNFLLGEAMEHWTAKPECSSYEVYQNVLNGGPDRIVVMEVDDAAAMQRSAAAPVRGGLQPFLQNHFINRRAELYTRMFPDYPAR